MKATWKGQVLAESDDTVVVEGNHYFPPEALRRERFRESKTHSVCPWKGTASYYDVVVGEDVNSDAAWYYPTPKPAAANIAGRVAFWKGVQVSLALLLLLAARPAAALDDLTGSWAGRVSCEVINDGTRTSTKSVSLVGIDDAGTGSVALSIDGIDFIGRIETDEARPDEGVLFATSCDFDSGNQVGAVIHGDVKTKPGSVKASLTGTVLLMNGPSGFAERCELKLQRLDLVEPTITC
jgi:uncharacterized protein (DUF427 family)